MTGWAIILGSFWIGICVYDGLVRISRAVEQLNRWKP